MAGALPCLGVRWLRPVGGTHYSCLEVPVTPSTAPAQVPVTLLRGSLIPPRTFRMGAVSGWEGEVTLTHRHPLWCGPHSTGRWHGFKDSKLWGFTVAGHEEQLEDDKRSP